MIFDEVITGFRVGWGGSQEFYKVSPDLTILGKIIGGGLPVGAYGGKKEIMRLVAPLGPVYQAGTLAGNPLAMAAGIATLEAVKKFNNPYERLEKLGEKLEKGLKKLGTVNRVGSMLTLFFTDQPVTDYSSAKRSENFLL